MAINQDFQQQDFFSRAPRDVSKDVIDWSEITGKFVDFINLERDRRMAAKAEIDKNISTTLATMDNLDVGMDVDFNNFMFEGANNMRQYLLTQEKLLKSNQISVAEFKRNLKNTEGLVTNFKNYTAQYNQAVAKREQMRMGIDAEGNPIEGGPILSAGDDWLMTHTGRYMDFGNAELVVGRDGTGGVVFTTDDISRPYDISSLQSMGNLINLSQQMFMKYDVRGDITAFVDELGAVTQGNYYENATSERFNDAYVPAKRNFIEATVEDPYKLQSLAADYLGDVDVDEMYTTDESKMDDSNFLVFVTKDGYMQPAMNSAGWKEVKKRATEELSDEIDSQTKESFEFRTKSDTGSGKKKAIRELYAQLDLALATGDPNAINLAAQAAEFELGFEKSGGVAKGTIQGVEYALDSPEGVRQFYLAAAEAVSNDLDLAGSEYDKGRYGSSMIDGDVSIIGTPLDSDGSSGSRSSTPSGNFMITTGSGSKLVFSRVSNASDLGFETPWENTKRDESERKKLLRNAFEELSNKTSANKKGSVTAELDSNNTWIVKNKDGTVLAKISDGRNGADFAQDVFEAYEDWYPGDKKTNRDD